MKKTVWGNCLVKNEDRYLWFAVNSVINYLDKILIWDSGSTDETLEIIKLLQEKFPKKIQFKEIGEVDKSGLTNARQNMLDETKSDWVFILDGDEVWWEESIKKVIQTIGENGENLDSIVTPYYSIVGDIYHYQEEAAGKYHLVGKTGHLNIRAISRKIPGLHLEGDYPNEAFMDKDNLKIQNRNKSSIVYLKAPYLHFSNISRSTIDDNKVMQRQRKIRHEIGLNFFENFKYPEVLYKEYPEIVPDPWQKMENLYKIRAFLETPLRKIHRKISFRNNTR